MLLEIRQKSGLSLSLPHLWVKLNPHSFLPSAKSRKSKTKDLTEIHFQEPTVPERFPGQNLPNSTHTKKREKRSCIIPEVSDAGFNGFLGNSIILIILILYEKIFVWPRSFICYKNYYLM